MTPMTVCSAPITRCAPAPVSVIRSVTASICASVASGWKMTSIAQRCHNARDHAALRQAQAPAPAPAGSGGCSPCRWQAFSPGPRAGAAASFGGVANAARRKSK